MKVWNWFYIIVHQCSAVIIMSTKRLDADDESAKNACVGAGIHRCSAKAAVGQHSSSVDEPMYGLHYTLQTSS